MSILIWRRVRVLRSSPSVEVWHRWGSITRLTAIMPATPLPLLGGIPLDAWKAVFWSREGSIGGLVMAWEARWLYMLAWMWPWLWRPDELPLLCTPGAYWTLVGSFLYSRLSSIGSTLETETGKCRSFQARKLLWLYMQKYRWLLVVTLDSAYCTSSFLPGYRGNSSRRR